MEGNFKKIYVSGKLQETRQLQAEVTIGLRKEGWAWEKITKFFSFTSMPSSIRTLERDAAQLKEHGTIVSFNHNSGRKTAASVEQLNILFGAILLSEESVDQSWVERFLKQNLGIDVSFATITRYLSDGGFTLQLAGRRKHKNGITQQNYINMYFNYVKTLHERGIFTRSSNTILCIDSCSNSRRLERQKGYNVKGAKQKKISDTPVTFTNNYIKCVSMDESGMFPTLMFTYDPAFKEGSSRWDDILRMCKKWNIDPSQLIYEEPDKGGRSRKVYNSESCDQLGHFKAVYKDQLARTTMFHDGGPAYKYKKQYIFQEDGTGVEVLPSIVHGELSVLDNHIFATAKNWWRQNRDKYDQVLADLYLVYAIDSVNHGKIKSMWMNNFMLGKPGLTLKRVEDFVKGAKRLSVMREKKIETYLEAYSRWDESRSPENQPVAHEHMLDKLDGSYWATSITPRKKK